MKSAVKKLISELKKEIKELDLDDKVSALNLVKTSLHAISPFKKEPVDCIVWVKQNKVQANDYNPNTVAPPEMELLRLSIESDGYTQPIVSMKSKNNFEVIDGFHRNRVGKECEKINKRINGYLPLTIINKSRESKTDRMASTIRHNRARGKHGVDSMSDIVVELKRRNWKNERICRELGMDEDEVLRLCQITGLAELFSDGDFSFSWDVEGDFEESDFEELTDDIKTYGDEAKDFRTVNTSDNNRTFHIYKKWECYKAGFYNTVKKGSSKEECEKLYVELLSNTNKFSRALKKITNEWKFSCEHYLSNVSMNRIAWLGQAAVCYVHGVPSKYSNGFNLLSKKKQLEANKTALKHLNRWLSENGLEKITLEDALSGRQSNIY